MTRIELDQEQYDVLVESLRGIPSERPVCVPANVLRAVLRRVDREALPSGEDELPTPPGDGGAAAEEAADGDA